MFIYLFHVLLSVYILYYAILYYAILYYAILYTYMTLAYLPLGKSYSCSIYGASPHRSYTHMHICSDSI